MKLRRRGSDSARCERLAEEPERVTGKECRGLDTNRLPNCRRYGRAGAAEMVHRLENISHQARSELRNKDGFVKVHLTSVKVGWQDRRYN